MKEELLLQQHRPDVRRSTRQTGEKGETLAARFLRLNGFRLVAANFTVPIGRNSRGAQVTGEIDLIALEEDALCFIEVKTRASRDFGGPLSAVDRQKQRQIIRAARVYRRIFGLFDMRFRYDVVTVITPPNGPPEMELFRDFWSETSFRKKEWHDDIL
ncbi:MAG: YraN family protein [Acidobacteria bacterium]|nr:YraN family protein [Acidobacteriota bacterium]